MRQVVQIRLREAGKITYYDAGELKLNVGDYCIIEAERGTEYGQVAAEPEFLEAIPTEEPLKKILRKATNEDIIQINKNKQMIKDAIDACVKRIEKRKLDMKLIEAEYSFDRSKLIFYFTAEGRIDFRELVKDLAHIFKVRIEMKQIGVRDEAKLLGGFGPCGRTLCCKKFLKDFEPVTIRMAKEQKLPLNPTKISGLCGRLMCCLAFEFETYRELLKNLPKEGDVIKTQGGQAKVISVNVLTRKVLVELPEGGQTEIDYSKK